MRPTWTFEHGHLVATLNDGRRVAAIAAAPPFDLMVDLLNANPLLSDRLLAGLQGKL